MGPSHCPPHRQRHRGQVVHLAEGWEEAHGVASNVSVSKNVLVLRLVPHRVHRTERLSMRATGAETGGPRWNQYPIGFDLGEKVQFAVNLLLIVFCRGVSYFENQASESFDDH